MTGELAGRRVLVTGASSGIGAAIADAVVEAGGQVALVARSADAIARQAARLGEAAVAAPADVADPDALAVTIREAADRMGGLDAVVCSAGIVRPGGIADSAPSDWQAMFDVNVLGVLNTVHGSLDDLLLAEPSDVIVISSMSGRRRTSVALGFYAATKHAVHVLADSLREELTPDGVRVTLISPGFVDTPIFDRVADDETRAQYQQAVASQGLAPAAVAAQVVNALSQPPGVNLVEIAMLSADQR
ncbi:SDR family oxidoreductase [Ilumatobacter sp.]|uniref:SDR family oxidoreductase n=1 Tax=Ilumatobacter sp. TaxID=1967498 RepID=UPI003AF6EFBA